MTKYITINKRRYEARDFDFNLVCDMQEMGINVLDISSLRNNPISAIRAYASLCIGADKQVVGEEIQAHVIAGGDFTEILTVMQEKMEESDFFQALNKEAEEDDPKTTTKKKSKEN